MRAAALLLLLLPAPSAGQAYFKGIGKNTWSADDPQKCLAWLLKYIPGSSRDANECDGDVCPCGSQGRVKTPSAHFGIHAVNCSHHPGGACRQADIELGWQARLGAMKEYSPIMDWNLGLWVASLAGVLDAFDAGGVEYHAMRWRDGGSEYYSAIANPCGAVLLEFISNSSGGRDPAAFRETNESRMQFVEWNEPTPAPSADNPLGVSPLRVSRPTTRLAEMVAWYTSLFSARVLHNATYADGTRQVTLRLPDVSAGPTSVHLQLWSRPDTHTADPSDCRDWTVAKWEEYQLGVHAAEMRGVTCGFDKWIDHHFSYDCLDKACDLADYTARLDQLGYKYHAAKPGKLIPLTFMYTYDPSGWGVELHFGHWTGAPPLGDLPPDCIHGAFSNGTCPGDLGTCS